MTGPVPMRARLADYLPWLARDYAANQGLSTLIVIGLIGFLGTFPMVLAGGWQLRQVPEAAAMLMLRQLTPTVAFIGALFATNGIISNDRRMGFYRFLFAKPLSPMLYYAQVFAVALAGMMVVTLVFLGAFALTIRAVFPPEMFLVVLVMVVAYGGIGFLLSALVRWDWLSLVTVVLFANVGWTVWRAETGLKKWLLYLLPPVHRTDSLYAIIGAPDIAFPWTSVAWLAGYGAACFALGLLAVRTRPLGSG